jgi:hypothetical protein
MITKKRTRKCDLNCTNCTPVGCKDGMVFHQQLQTTDKLLAWIRKRQAPRVPLCDGTDIPKWITSDAEGRQFVECQAITEPGREPGGR